MDKKDVDNEVTLMSENIIRFLERLRLDKIKCDCNILIFFKNKNLNNYTYDLNVDLNLEKIRNE